MIHETRHSIAEILSRQPMFQGLDQATLELLAFGTGEYRVRKNEMLFQKEDRVMGMYLVFAGQIKLFLPSSQGVERVIHMAGPGETFGEEMVFLGKNHAFSAQADKDAYFLIVSNEVLQQAMDRNRAFCRAMMNGLCERMNGLLDNIETYTQRSSAQRVAHYLSQHAPRACSCYEVALGTQKQTIASHLNLAPETLSRALSRLAKEGFIHMQGASITVMNPRQLRSYAG